MNFRKTFKVVLCLFLLLFSCSRVQAFPIFELIFGVVFLVPTVISVGLGLATGGCIGKAIKKKARCSDVISQSKKLFEDVRQNYSVLLSYKNRYSTQDVRCACLQSYNEPQK